MGRTSSARERLLDATRELMGTRGYTALGVAEICAHADVRKGSFYHFFASKQALTLEVIDAHWSRQRADWIAVLGAAAPALQRLRNLFDGMTRLQRQARQDTGAVSGCLLANLALELSNQEPAVQARLQEIFDEQIALVRATLEQAAAEGRVPVASTGEETARAVLAHLEGMVMFAKLANSPELLDGLWSHTLLLLRAPGQEAR
ncbi:TetR family transcriptional regulator [Streptomyces sp. NPDC046261]|uniref:TetR/AcrR family transcriptional regulator n=1 Tax=Streptomyces sp. NPDC046261 TaxID=3157200 RepID=UPI0033FBDEC1